MPTNVSEDESKDQNGYELSEIQKVGRGAVQHRYRCIGF